MKSLVVICFFPGLLKYFKCSHRSRHSLFKLEFQSIKWNEILSMFTGNNLSLPAAGCNWHNKLPYLSNDMGGFALLFLRFGGAEDFILYWFWSVFSNQTVVEFSPAAYYARQSMHPLEVAWLPDSPHISKATSAKSCWKILMGKIWQHNSFKIEPT